MAAVSSPLREAPHGAGLTLGVAVLALLGALMGFGLVLGEADAALVAVSVIACLGVLYDFRIGAVLMIVLLPIAESSIFPRGMFGLTGLNPLNLVLGATLVSYVVRGRTHPPAGPLAPKQLFWLFVLPLCVAGLIGSRHASEALPLFYEAEVIHFLDGAGYLRDILAKPLIMVLIALLVGAAVARSKKPEGFLVAMGVAIWMMCYLSISLVARTSLSLADISAPGARMFLGGVGLHANDLGRLYAVAYAFLLFAWSESNDRKFKLACVATMGVVVLALLFTFSRGAFLGFMVVNALFILWRFNAKTGALAVVAGIVLLVALPPEFYERLAMGFDTGDLNEVSAGRIDTIWLPLLPELLSSPIWGNGLSSVMWSEPMLTGQMYEVTHPHNAYLEVLLDMGLLGLVLVIGYYVHVWKGFRALGNNAFLSPEMRGFYKGAAAGLLSFFVTGIAGSSFVPRPEYAFLWLAIGMMYGQFARRPAS